jgi:hyperosmotically inducible protein
MIGRKLSGLSRLLAVATAASCTIPASLAQNHLPGDATSSAPHAAHDQNRSALSGGDLLDDWDLMGRVRAALFADPELSRHNLIVVVRGGVVELDGPVPSASLRDRVLQVVRSVPGVRQLRERLRIQADSWSGRAFRRQLPPVDEPWKTDGSGIAPPPMGLPAVTFSSLHSERSPTNSTPPEAIFRLPTLLPPQAETTAGMPGVWPTPNSNQTSTQLLLEQYLRKQWRYRQVQFVLQGTTLVLTGIVESVEDRRELLQFVSQLPGIRAIRADGLRVEPASPAQ